MDSNHGSVWRKWDFHVHTPYSILNNNFGFDPFESSGTTLESKFDEYVIKLFTAAVQQEIAAIGITDYFMIEGYKRIKQNYLDCPEKMRQCFPDEALRHAVEQIYVFPNIELRLNNFIGKDAHSVNYHVCFSSDISIQEIEDNFLHRLDFKFDNAPYPLTISNLKLLGNHIKSDNEISGSDIFVGLNHVTVSYTDVLEKLQNNPAFTGKYLIVIPVDEDLPKVSWKGRIILPAETYINNATVSSLQIGEPLTGPQLLARKTRGFTNLAQLNLVFGVPMHTVMIDSSSLTTITFVG